MHYVGIDPGVTMTGMVLLDDKHEVCAWAAYSCPPGPPNFRRALSLSRHIYDRMRNWRLEYSIDALRVGLEMPIWKRNPSTFSLQWRTIQMMEASIWELSSHFIGGKNDGQNVELVEVNNKSAKLQLAHDGDADKDAMVAASPFKILKINKDIKEAIADAYAHALVAINARRGIINLSTMEPAEVILEEESSG